MRPGKLSKTNSEFFGQNSAILVLVLKPLLDELYDQVQRHKRVPKNQMSRFFQIILGRIPWDLDLSNAKKVIVEGCIQSLVSNHNPSQPSQTDYLPGDYLFDKSLETLQSTYTKLIEARCKNTKLFYLPPDQAERAVQEAITILTSLSDRPDRQIDQWSKFKKRQMELHLLTFRGILAGPLEQKQANERDNLFSPERITFLQMQGKLSSKSTSNRSVKKENYYSMEFNYTTDHSKYGILNLTMGALELWAYCHQLDTGLHRY